MAASLKLALLLVSAACAWAAELTTGPLLGAGYDARSFYARDTPAAKWTKTASGGSWRPEAAGKLMNVRVAQALFHDEWLSELQMGAAYSIGGVAGLAVLKGLLVSGALAIAWLVVGSLVLIARVAYRPRRPIR